MVKKILAGAVCGAALAVAIFGAGPASAINELAGRTYEKAAAAISNSGGTAVIASRIGDYLPTNECIVTGSRPGNRLDASGNSRGGITLLDLNCNDTSALNGHPGNSVVTPGGQKALLRREQAKSISENYAKALAAEKEPYCATKVDTCILICKEGRVCSAELLEYLGV